MNNALFRALRTDGKGWVYGNIIRAADGVFVLEKDYPVLFNEPEYHQQGMGCGLEDRGIHDRYDAMAHGWECAIERAQENLPVYIPVIPETVGQFTGLKDMEDTDIYEGDILDINRKRAVVSFDKGCFLTVIGESNYRLGGWSLEAVNIIGNIHEHPHLLT